MAFWKTKDHAKQQPLTPWEKYQQQATANEKATEKKHFTWSGKRIRIGDKLPKLQHQRRRLLTKRASLLIAAFGVIALIMGYAISPLSHISAVTVKNNAALSTSIVMRDTKIKPGVALWSVIGHDQRTSKSTIKRNPQLKRVQTKLVGINRVQVTITEIPIAGYVVRKSGYQPVLETGQILSQTVSQPTGNSPIYAGFKSGQQFKQMIGEYANLPSAVKHNISELQFSPTKADPERVHLFMNDGNEVYAAITGFGKKMAYYPGIAAKLKTKSIVNLEVGAYSYPIKKH